MLVPDARSEWEAQSAVKSPRRMLEKVSPLEWTGWISLQSRDCQEFSPTPQFKSIKFFVLSFLHSPTLTSIYDYW